MSARPDHRARALLALGVLAALLACWWLLEAERESLDVAATPSDHGDSAATSSNDATLQIAGSAKVDGSGEAPSARVELDESGEPLAMRAEQRSVYVHVAGLLPGRTARVQVVSTTARTGEQVRSQHDTDVSGRLLFAAPLGELSLDAWAEDMRAVPVRALVAERPLEIELRLLDRVQLHGRVQHASSREPIADASVTLRGLGSHTRSDAAGRFALWLPVDGDKYELRCEADGYGSECWSVMQHADGSWLMGFEGEQHLRSRSRFRAALPELVLELLPARTIRGEVHGPDGPLAGARVHARGDFRIDRARSTPESARAETDAMGRFELRALRPDITHLLTITHEPHPQLGRLVRRQVLVPASAEPEQHVGLVRLDRGCTVTLRLADRSGAPIEQALLVLSAEVPSVSQARGLSSVGFPRDETPTPLLRHTVRTATDGSASITAVAPGRYELELLGGPAEIVPSRVDVLEFPEQRLELVLPSSARITGRVADAEGPLAGVRIELDRSRGRSTLSAADGSFSIAGLIEGRTYELRASRRDSRQLAWLSQSREAKPGDVVEFVLEREH